MIGIPIPISQFQIPERCITGYCHGHQLTGLFLVTTTVAATSESHSCPFTPPFH